MQLSTLRKLWDQHFSRKRADQEALAAKGYFREHSHSSANPTILVKRPVWAVRDARKAMEHPGRPNGAVPGSYISDLSSEKKTILLCGACKKGFDWKKHGYYSVSHYDHIFAAGRCDVCKDVGRKLALYLHEYHELGGFMTRDKFRSSRLGKTII